MGQSQRSQQRTPANAEMDAFNAAFDELGLEWHWDLSTMAELAPIGDDNARVRAYIEGHHPHLLKVYDAGFLSTLVVDTMRRQGVGASASAHAAMQHELHA